MKEYFTEADYDRIERAVRKAEDRTSGEIVVYIQSKSDHYEDTSFTAALIGAIGAIAVGLLTTVWYDGWGLGWLHQGWGVALLATCTAGAFAIAAAMIPGIRRWLVPTERLDRIVRLQAYRAFVEEEVFATGDRTGILIFVSLFEHRVEIIGDAGINNRVPDGAWSNMVDALTSRIRAGAITEGLVEAVGTCGELLRERGLEPRVDDRDELSDRPRTRTEP